MNDQPAFERRWIALALLAMAQFIVVLDASIVNVALPSIGRDLKLSQEGLSWVVNAYVLAFGGFLLLGGRLADMFGRRRMFVAGLLVFAAASLAGGFATSEAQLIVARAVQGFGAAMLSPAALSTVTVLFADGAERNKALGIWGAVAGAGGAAGVLLGGVLTEIGWEWVFLVNVPVGVGCALLAPRLLPESRSTSKSRHFDFAGAFSITAGLTLLVYSLVEAPSNGWLSTRTLTLIGVAVILHIAFLVIESRSKNPIVPFGVLKNRTRVGANVVGLLVGASLFSMFFFISLYMQNVLGYAPLKTGLAYLPLTVAIILSAGAASQLVTKVGFRPVMAFGLLMVGIGLLWFSRISSPGSYLGDVLPASVIAAIGLGFSFVPVTIAAISNIEEKDSGLASGMINTSQQIGGALGLAILVTVSTSRITSVKADGAQPLDALLEGYSTAFLAGSLMAALGLIATLVLIGKQDSRDYAATVSTAASEVTD
ncbi:MAG: MFS transporter [Thermoleophilaceae bacterium]|nr:MFS transporter [Thermoleophilaceae bacterium]